MPCNTCLRHALRQTLNNPNKKLLIRLLSGNADANFDLDDLVNILYKLSFDERKDGGSHRIFSLKGIEGIINLQKTKDGKAKAYQVKHV